ncbi:MAG TPA: hypothetical protein DCQ31_18700 [Bacteroidales bacterium]|nr:hypothetical protein [Bacteroidales bacterium]
MPNKDGTGPVGKEKGTGRGLGNCNPHRAQLSEKPAETCLQGRGRRGGKGNGMRHRRSENRANNQD